jgi:hypothetical protein
VPPNIAVAASGGITIGFADAGAGGASARPTIVVAAAKVVNILITTYLLFWIAKEANGFLVLLSAIRAEFSEVNI